MSQEFADIIITVANVVSVAAITVGLPAAYWWIVVTVGGRE